jgi:hypothetical protein
LSSTRLQRIRNVMADRQRWLCYWCGERMLPTHDPDVKRRCTADHIVPRQAGGHTTASNIVAAFAAGWLLPQGGATSATAAFSTTQKGADMLAPPKASIGTCSIPGCGRPRVGRGFCMLHWQRDRAGYDLLAPLRTPNGSAIAFIDKAAKYTGTDCLIWPFSLKPNGYGSVHYPSRRSGTASYVVCELAHDPAPSPQHEAAHSCRNPACVAPNHLRWATPQENSADKIKHGTLLRGSTIGAAKLTEAKVLAIRMQRHRKGEQLAAEYGVSCATISRIRNRLIWAWLEDDATTSAATPNPIGRRRPP